MLDLLIPRPRANSTGSGGWTFGSTGIRRKTRAGVTLDEEIALTYEAVFRATCVLAEGVGGIPPLNCYERISYADRKLANLEVANIFRFGVNPRTPSGVFREGRVSHQVNWGSGFAEIVRDAATDQIAELWPIHPSRVMPARDDEYDYLIRMNSGPPMPMYAHEILHIPGALSDDAIWGRGVIEYGRETIGLGIGTERSAQGFFGSGGHPKGVVEIPGMNDRQKRADFREEWNEIHGNAENNLPTVAIVAPGTKYMPISLTNEANQLIETRQVNKSNIATLYGIPAYKINAEGKETAGTIEQKAIEFVVYSLLPWARKWEEQCNLKLLTKAERERFYFEHNFTALLRGDQAARYTAYRIAFSIGVMSINEIRRLENMPGIGPAGDQYFVPANMTTVERAMEGDFGNGGALGSDTTGAPADNPTDREARRQLFADRSHAEWLKGLGTKSQRQEATQQLKSLEKELPSRPVQWGEAARIALVDVLSRMFVKEANEAQRAAKGNTDFEKWIREFYAKHESIMTEALAPACFTLGIIGVTEFANPSNLAAWLKARNADALKASHNSDTPTVFARKLAAWPTERANRLAEEIVGHAAEFPVWRLRPERRRPELERTSHAPIDRLPSKHLARGADRAPANRRQGSFVQNLLHAAGNRRRSPGAPREHPGSYRFGAAISWHRRPSRDPCRRFQSNPCGERKNRPYPDPWPGRTAPIERVDESRRNRTRLGIPGPRQDAGERPDWRDRPAHGLPGRHRLRRSGTERQDFCRPRQETNLRDGGLDGLQRRLLDRLRRDDDDLHARR